LYSFVNKYSIAKGTVFFFKDRYLLSELALSKPIFLHSQCFFLAVAWTPTEPTCTDMCLHFSLRSSVICSFSFRLSLCLFNIIFYFSVFSFPHQLSRLSFLSIFYRSVFRVLLYCRPFLLFFLKLSFRLLFLSSFLTAISEPYFFPVSISLPPLT
jgi:hypothetical protein